LNAPNSKPVILDRPAGEYGAEERPQSVNDEDDKLDAEEMLHLGGSQNPVALHGDGQLE